MKGNLSYDPEAFRGASNIVIIVLTILTLAWLIVGPLLIKSNWGFNQLDYIPGIMYYIWIAVALALIAFLFIKPRKHFISSLLKDFLWGDKKLLGTIGVLILAGIIFLVFRFEAHVYGEGYIRIGNIVQRSTPVFPWYEYGGATLPYFLYLLLTFFGLDKIAAGHWAYQIMSICSGLIFVFFSLRTALIAFDDDDDRLGFWLLFLFSGVSLFFFSFVELVPLMLAIISPYLYTVVKLNKNGESKHLMIIWILTIFAVFIHIQGITLLPSTFYLTLRTLVSRTQIGRFIGTLGSAILIISGIVIVYLMSMENIYLENLILYFAGKPPETDYALFSIHHLVDIFNLLFMIIPFFTIFIYAIVRGIRFLHNEKTFTALGFLTMSQVVYLFIIDPKNGMARDIDNYIFLLSGFLFLGIYSLFKLYGKINLSGNIIMVLCPISFLILLPMYYVHLSPAKFENYLDRYLSYNETKYESGLYAMRDYYSLAGQTSKSVQMERAINSKAPGALESQLINDLYVHGRVDEAFEYALRLTERFPYNAKYRMQKGNLLKYYRRFEAAEEELKIAVRLDPYGQEYHHFLAELYRETRQKNKWFQVLSNALSIIPRSKTLLVDLTGYYYRDRQYKTVDSLTRVILEIDSLEPYAFLYKGLIAEERGHKETAMELYEKFIRMGETLPEIGIVRKRLNNLFLELNDTLTTDSSETTQ